jgi:replicative DNA helicase
MCYLAGEWLKMGKNVLYITLEMSEEAVQERIDANLLDISTDDLKNPDLDKEWFLGKVNALKLKTVGKLIVKEYPTSSAHSGHFRHLLKELRQKKKFKPDVIFIDYINICASARYKAGGGANSYTTVKSTAEELRGLAVEFNLPIVTATQTTREGMSSQNPDMASTSESVGLPQTLDWFAAIVTNDELMEMGRQMMILIKTRFGNKQGMKRQLLGIDWNRMRYSDVDSDTEKDQKVKAVQQAVAKDEPLFNKQPRVTGIPADIDWG